MKTTAAVLEAARPKQWVKNAFVLAGLVFSGSILSGAADLRAWLMVIAFCAASSATYLVNDVVDAQSDRLNPRTAERPIARGDLRPQTALLYAAGSAAVALAVAFLLGWQAGLVIVGYFVLQVAYSMGIKRIALLDVLAVSAGFVLRALGGIVAIPVALSAWLLVCTGLLALFLALGKRRGELVSTTQHHGARRASVRGYTLALLDQLLAITSATIIVSYAIYAVAGSRTPYMGLTIPFVVYGVFRVLQVMHVDGGVTEDPSALALRDRPLQTCVVLWAGTATVISLIQ